MKKKYLVIAPHPDDETLGCGASIHSLIKNNNNLRVVFLGEGSTCRFESSTKKEILNKAINERKKFSLKALKALKVKNYHFYDLPCGKFDQIPILKIAKIIEKEIINFKPNTIFTHSETDVHIDHQRVFQATLQATRPSLEFNVESVMSFEILSIHSTLFKLGVSLISLSFKENVNSFKLDPFFSNISIFSSYSFAE